MKSILFVFMLLGGLGTVQGQDITQVGASINGTKVTINDKNPIGFKDSVDGINFRVGTISDVGVNVEVANNSDDMVSFSYNDSYFIVDGKTETIISRKTLMINKDKPIQDVKIAPNTSVRLELINKERTEDYGTIWYMFSNKKANNVFKNNKASDKVTMVLVIKKENGDKIKKEIIFTIRGSIELKEIKKGLKST
ncbi:hypothetical protein [Sphingobacterium sp. 2149]|uniref:hypothetical protein n=1 Tax=Sphingobacterium sp. 2149 TaxID=2817763 RepID=UPI002854A854|nr:hypothetical protein [Sphingobacterium sp. 2149]MDR6734165.1 hypothetical protein [Sphingobacterium sp. 2149]